MDDNHSKLQQILNTHREINKAFLHLLHKAATQHGISPVQLIVLGKLSEHPNIRLSDLADRMSIGNSTMSGIIDRMVKAGYVSRERTEADRRAMTLNLTDKGWELREATEETRIAMLEPLLQLSDQDLLEWHRLQKEIIRIIKTS
ncbi:MarR family winged helix-turn-helix transcriptional regulator [Cohnella panacarvi]|uniref:MarR family winged helix-turn-helix transcriptional regulator n=1 Tax=Cohnella panacarvi TaxID=400776 RepID=UPI0004792788|nr:MarR family transcriptional regulator [Cohnella panacarvi]